MPQRLVRRPHALIAAPIGKTEAVPAHHLHALDMPHVSLQPHMLSLRPEPFLTHGAGFTSLASAGGLLTLGWNFIRLHLKEGGRGRGGREDGGREGGCGGG